MVWVQGTKTPAEVPGWRLRMIIDFSDQYSFLQ